MENPNDRLRLDKPEPFKRIDWILVIILVLVILATFRVLGRFYISLLPLIFFGLLIYVIVRLASRNSNGDGGFEARRMWDDILFFLRKYFRKIAITAIVILSLGVGSVLIYQSASKGGVTTKQLQRMSQALSKHKNELGYYPKNLTELAGSNPLRREWLQDSWGNNISYTVTKNGSGYRLVSAGPDGVTGSADDLTVEE